MYCGLVYLQESTFYKGKKTLKNPKLLTVSQFGKNKWVIKKKRQKKGEEVQQHLPSICKRVVGGSRKNNPINFKSLPQPRAFPLLNSSSKWFNLLLVCSLSIKVTNCSSSQKISPPARPVSQAQKIKTIPRRNTEYLGARAYIPQSNEWRKGRDYSVCYGLLNIYRCAFKGESLAQESIHQ